MSITYEEALETLEAMFGSPWTRESLDVVLRHFQGHMENTVESILSHGDGDPDVLLKKLKNPPSEDVDQQLARQLAAQEQRQASSGGAAQSNRKKGRGTEIALPPDFLRIPGRVYSAAAASSAANSTMDQDEALARMLQDELFSQELANNPEFAHLARPRTSGGRPVSSSSQRGGRIGELPNRASSARPVFQVGGGGGDDGPRIMEKLSDMGHEAKKRLQLLAAQWGQASSRFAAQGGGSHPAPSSAMTLNETRGLLDADDGEEMELSFAKTKKQ